ncbi:MAG TPA: hypothetical protein PK906_13595 [Spirochaetota bacterium]|nr:hypothetical protein [Spirochaetota bacterium]
MPVSHTASPGDIHLKNSGAILPLSAVDCTHNVCVSTRDTSPPFGHRVPGRHEPHPENRMSQKASKEGGLRG